MIYSQVINQNYHVTLHQLSDVDENVKIRLQLFSFPTNATGDELE